MCIFGLLRLGESAVNSVILEQACKQLMVFLGLPGARGTVLVTAVEEVKGKPKFDKLRFVLLKPRTAHIT